ncbi:SpaA isopeptide-forming pilin-related protein [Aeoliella sp. ICT_H6.2]|uniref:SpaA isopeptide-forming pilin-related protein n=1 Tax=Aeoliella straminimaris TaxID=2954799 RepID=A0A9X2JH43_9BACT|nr:SpaA isopeptide-forming pilin-related protein [Aeoliella straminimaris]
MGLLDRLFGPKTTPTIVTPRERNARRSAPIRGQVELLEPRQLLAADGLAPEVLFGSVYFEEASGDDSQPDVIEVTFVGGAEGTTLNRLVINGDKRLDGLNDGDIFFDTEAGGLGAFKAVGLSVVEADGFIIDSVSVTDGGTQIVFTFSGFDAGESLKFSVDADEMQFADPSGDSVNSLVEGAEFERSTMTGEFSAVGYVDLTLEATYWDAFDDRRGTAQSQTGLELDLPDDAYSTTHDYTDRTAGAVVHDAQIPLATLSGWVYHDRSNDGIFDPGSEEGIGGVTLELLDAAGNPTGITTVTSSEPGQEGYYEFRNLEAGTYGVREVQPVGWLDGIDTPGSHGGTAADESSGRVDRITGAVLAYGDDGVEYNFGELLVGSISGRVSGSRDADCYFDDPQMLLSGVTIDLLDADGNVLATTVTDENGEYRFDDLTPGEYQIREHQPDGYYDGGERVGSAGGVKSDIGDIYSLFSEIQLGSGVDATDYFFCEHIGPSLSGWVYHDRSNDGIFDTGTEEGIGNVLVELLDANGQPTGITTITSTETGKVGYYEFTNLAPGTYGVREYQPTGWIDGIDTAGTHSGVAASELSGPVDRITGAVLAFGDVAQQYNFGELLPGSIAGRVTGSTDGECHFDDPELLLEGVQIDLLDEYGQVVATTFTDVNGEYQFTELLPGVYEVYEHQPEGYLNGGRRVGSLGGEKTGTDNLSQIVVGSDMHGVNYDFCEHTPGSIAGFVMASTGPDCDFDNPEILLEGVQIDLFDAAGTLLATTYTDAQGRYRFDGLDAGEYLVREHQPAGYFDGEERVGTAGGTRVAPDDIASIQLAASQDAVNYDFCEHVGVSLSGWVYHDRSNDGIFDRGSEVGIGQVTLKLLDADGNDTGRRAVTNDQGYYEFTDLESGTYSVMEIHPTGWLDGIDTPGNLGGVSQPSPPGDMISQITIAFGQSGSEYNFGELLPGSIRGQVHVDTDGDCIAKEGEPVIPGVQIDLLDEQGNVLETTYTDENGEYVFDNLRPGHYTVYEHQPIEYFNGGYHIGSGGGSYFGIDTMGDIPLGSDEHLVEYDFCEIPPAKLSGYVFIDGEPILVSGSLPDDLWDFKDGVRTPDDRPLAGVVLELRNGASGDPIFGDEALSGYYGDGPIRTVTDANGYYEFAGLPAGTYAVVEVHPDGLIDSIDTEGSLGGLVVNAGNPLHEQQIEKTVEQQAAIEQMRARFGNDIIFRVPLQPGQHSVENNFSEVETRTFWLPPETPPPEKPPVFTTPTIQVTTPLYPLIAPEKPDLVHYGGSSNLPGYTWHLSLVNAGFPRSTPVEGQALMHLTATQMNATWQETEMDQAVWTLGEDEVALDADGTSQLIFGHPRGIPVVGDWDGDGVDEIGVFIDGHWYLDLNGNGRWDAGDIMAELGDANDLPATGDWDGDGKTDIAIFGPVWMGDPLAIENEPGLPDIANNPGPLAPKAKNVPPEVDEATTGSRTLQRTRQGKPRRDLIDHVFHYGTSEDKPVTGDWNGDGIATIGVFRGGVWTLDVDGDGHLTDSDLTVEFGGPGIPVVGDWDGDGIDDLAVFADGQWTIDSDGNRELDAVDRVFEMGTAGDRPVAGDWNGDGVDEPAVYTPSAETPPPREAA